MNGAALAGSIALAAAAAAFGSAFGTGQWRREIAKPDWNPPDGVFGPVWSFLYLSMAIAAWLVWLRRDRAAVALPLVVYTLQLLLNALWSWIFFGMHAMGWAFVEIMVLNAFILATLILFWRVHLVAGLLFLPYIAWTSFAAFLNFTLWRIN